MHLIAMRASTRFHSPTKAAWTPELPTLELISHTLQTPR
jgi:hypothetical protein